MKLICRCSKEEICDLNDQAGKTFKFATIFATIDHENVISYKKL